MKKYKTISQVLRQGQIVVNGPVAIIMILVPILFYLLTPKEYAGMGVFIGFVLGFALAWAWWSYKIVKWRIWAFENTKKSDWGKLKQEAISQQLIWDDGIIFEKTEFRNESEKNKLKRISTIIREQDQNLEEIIDDPKIPNKIDYSYKKMDLIFSVIIPLVLLGIGIYLMSLDNLMIGFLSIGMAIYSTNLNKIRNITKRKIQLSISNKGIDLKFKDIGFVKWEDTEDIALDTKKGILSFGIWDNDDFSQVDLPLNDLEVEDYYDFLRAVNIYIKRSLDN